MFEGGLGLRAVCILATAMIGEGLVQVEAIELPVFWSMVRPCRG
jgi:hypothetical protein